MAGKVGDVWTYKSESGKEVPMTWGDCALAIHAAIGYIELLLQDKELSDTKRFYYKKVSAMLMSIYHKFHDLSIISEQKQRGPAPTIPGGRRVQ